ncbi:putative uncharacterized protein [Clostridium sp. CAG:440]|jgi:hypothetical protein|nr:putative uncharacterized protein [Clostridium sp. CAG:440]HJJ16134.1 hypothetical protein [Clostridiaceae bacterium]
MVAFVNLYSKNKGELNNFLSKFYNNNLKITDDNSWEKDFNNPVEIAELVGAYIDNNDNYNISMWICLDEGVLIKITNKNADDIIKYLYERFPY